MPATTTAQEITNGSDYVIECPVGHRAFFALQIWESVDFAYDNFTISELNLNISSNSLLNVRVSKSVRLSGWNYTFVEVWQGQAIQYNITVDDLYEEQEVFNSSRWGSVQTNSTHRIETWRYHCTIPYFMVEVENIGSVDALVLVEKSYIIETLGDREIEVNVTLREPYITTYPPVYTTNTTPVLLIEVVRFEVIMIGVLVIGGCIGAIVGLLIRKRGEVNYG